MLFPLMCYRRIVRYDALRIDYVIGSTLLLSVFCNPYSLSAKQMSAVCYQYSEPFHSSSNNNFKGTEVTPLWVYVDHEGGLDIEEISSHDTELPWQYAHTISPHRDVTYWLKTCLVSDVHFAGEQVFMVGQDLGDDLHAYDSIDVYTLDKYGDYEHLSLGRHIPPDDRPIDFWANLIPIEIVPGDMTTVYIRLKGMSLSYPPSSIALWHIDFVDLFSRQLFLAQKSFLYYGILGIQVLFFLLLYFIERERVYLAFSIFGLGLFFTRAFSEYSFMSFVPIPELAVYNELLFHSSVYLTVAGGFFFMIYYLALPKKSFLVRRGIPIFLGLTLISYIRFMFRFSFSVTGHFPVLLTPAIYTIAGIFLAVYLIFSALKHKQKSPFLLILAITPCIVATMLILLNDGAHLTFYMDNSWLLTVIDKQAIDNICTFFVILFIITISLDVGFKSQRLKYEKTSAEQDRLIAQQQLRDKERDAEKAQEINALKSRLYTNITHEFRTPITVIMGINEESAKLAQTLQISYKVKEKLEQGHKLIARNSKNLLRLINQLLDLSKSDVNKLQLRLIQDDIIPYLKYLTASFTNVANDKGVELRFNADLRSKFMDYDEQRIQQILYNLLSNAIKFTPEHGKIEVNVSELAGEQPILLIDVSDSGIGIPQETILYVFDRFYQVNDSLTRQVEGSGIGLALTKDIVELMGGSISVVSSSSKGTTFRVRLPISQIAPITDISVSHNIMSDAHDQMSITLVDVYSEDDIEEMEDKPLLLIVEDNKDVHIYLQRLLRESYKILTASDGQQGVDKALSEVPDLIISDVMMPIMDGYELTNTLKNDRRTSHVPIILLTAKATDEDRILGLKKGADAYLSKPFVKQELMVRIEQLLKIRKTLITSYNQTLTTSEPHSTHASIDTDDAEQLFLQEIRSIILDNIKESGVNATFLAQQLGLSKSQLYRKLRALTGNIPSTVVNDIRLSKSTELLINSRLNIAEIAFEVGYSLPGYYSKLFTKKYGESPTLYRQRISRS